MATIQDPASFIVMVPDDFNQDNLQKIFTNFKEGGDVQNVADDIKLMRQEPQKSLNLISLVINEEESKQAADSNAAAMVQSHDVTAPLHFTHMATSSSAEGFKYISVTPAFNQFNMFMAKVPDKAPDLQPPQPFNNVTLFSRMTPGDIFQPESLEDMVKIIKKAANERKHVKAVGTCYAFSDVSYTDGYLLEMNRHLHEVLVLDKSVLKDASNEHVEKLLKVESGTMIESINEALWPSKKRDNPSGFRTVLNQTGYQGLSIGGIISTGAHGSGINKPPVVNMVASMHLVTVDSNYEVKQYWLEPSNGITDPKKFKTAYGAKGWELIQDDDTFYSSICSMGCLGVVYSYVIHVQPAYYLQEHRYHQTWEKTKAELPKLLAENMSPRKEGSMHSFEIWISPYPEKLTHKVMSVVSTYTWAVPPRRNSRPRVFHAKPWKMQFLRKATVAAAKLVPWFMPEILNLALLATVYKHPATMPCTEALDFGSPNSAKVVVSDMGIDATSADNVIKATDTLIALFQSILKENRHQFASSPFSLRFTAPADAYAAPQYARPSCMIEAPILVGTPGADDTLTKFRKCLRENFDGRPHWGQINDMDYAKFETLFPDTCTKVQSNFKKFHPTQTFSNLFTTTLFSSSSPANFIEHHGRVQKCNLL